MSARLDWASILDVAGSIVRTYSTGVTLRQLFYRLVAAEYLPNTTGAYKQLSHHTAQARRAGRFPDLLDRKREFSLPYACTSVAAELRTVAKIYRLDRTEGQATAIYLANEKDGQVEQLKSWFSDRGLPVIGLNGYCSQGHADRIAGHVRADGRPAVLIYAGDFDPSGEDIDRDFVARTDCWAKVVRVALTAAQVDEYALPPQPGKQADSRAAGFVARHGRLVQVELDALPPETLRGLYADAVEEFWDPEAFDRVLDREAEDRAAISRFVESYSTGGDA